MNVRTQVPIMLWDIDTKSHKCSTITKDFLLTWKWYSQNCLCHILLTGRCGFLCPQSLVRCSGVGGGHLSPWLTGHLESLLGLIEWPEKVTCITLLNSVTTACDGVTRGLLLPIPKKCPWPREVSHDEHSWLTKQSFSTRKWLGQKTTPSTHFQALETLPVVWLSGQPITFVIQWFLI